MAWRSRGWVALAMVATTCNVFEPPELKNDGGAATGGTIGGSGGNDASLGGTVGGGTGGIAGGGTGGIAGGGGVSGSSATGGVAGSGGSAGDAGPVGKWWPFTTPEGCQSEGVPTVDDRPKSGGTGTSLNPILLATSRMRFGSANDDQALTPNKDAWKEIGLDIDKSCTSSPTCTTSDGGLFVEHACKNSFGLIPYDGSNCRDNQIGKLFPVAALSPFVGPLFGVTEPNWNCALHRGEFAIFTQIRDYDGSLNDPSVRVDMYTSIGLQALPNWTCTSGPNGTVPSDWFNQAPWLPTNPWKIAKRSIALSAGDAGVGLPDAKASDPAAYVRDGYLFASLPPGAEFWLDGQRSHITGFRLLLHRAVLVGRLIKELDGTWSIKEGLIGGLVLPTEILSSFREIGFCQNMCDAYTNVVNYLNTNQDALSSTSQKLPETPCNALSMGIAFEARQAAASQADIEDVNPPVDCPPPKNPLAPKHGCTCPPPGVGGPCVPPDN